MVQRRVFERLSAGPGERRAPGTRAGELEARGEVAPGRLVESVERQLASADRLKQQSEQTAASLRLTQTRLDELVARAAEVRVGTFDTDTYARDVDDLVIQLEALHQAVAETSGQ